MTEPRLANARLRPGLAFPDLTLRDQEGLTVGKPAAARRMATEDRLPAGREDERDIAAQRRVEQRREVPASPVIAGAVLSEFRQS